MKTIEESAKIIYNDAKNIGAFINGVEFAQRWINPIEELPEESLKLLHTDQFKREVTEYVIVKTKATGFQICRRILEADGWKWPGNRVVTKWRPIELK